jgi:hypothetical protein
LIIHQIHFSHHWIVFVFVVVAVVVVPIRSSTSDSVGTHEWWYCARDDRPNRFMVVQGGGTASSVAAAFVRESPLPFAMSSSSSPNTSTTDCAHDGGD